MSPRVSPRYTVHLALLLGLATAVSFLHREDRFTFDDCRDSSRMFASSADQPRLDEKLQARFAREFGDASWSYRVVPLPSLDSELETFVVRSSDPKILYHRPEGRVVRGARPFARTVENVTNGSETLPVHRTHYESSRRGSSEPPLVAYLLVYGGKPIANPYWSQVVSAPLQLVRGRRPMWLFFVSATPNSGQRGEVEAAALEWLAEAWGRYDELCG